MKGEFDELISTVAYFSAVEDDFGVETGDEAYHANYKDYLKTGLERLVD